MHPCTYGLGSFRTKARSRVRVKCWEIIGAHLMAMQSPSLRAQLRVRARVKLGLGYIVAGY